MRTAIFLPAKGTSERIENKNIRLLDGTPLFMVTLQKLMKCNFIDEVWLDSDSQAIHDIAGDIPCRRLLRDPGLATNKTDGNRMFINEVNHTDADVVIQILCTSPFIQPETIRQGIEALKANPDYDSAVLVHKEKRYEWNERGPAYDFTHIPNAVDLPYSIKETMGLYMVRRETALRLGRRIGDHPFLLYASPLEAIDINDPDDLPLAELIAAGKREKDRRRFSLVRTHLSSPMLSDILDDLNCKAVIPHLKSNVAGAKILGRAFTLHLRSLRDNEDLSGIYNAIDTYKYVVPGDIIMVHNEIPGYAYFGELNANMAVRAGAVGAVIGGMTRDSDVTSAMGFPVFSHGVSCTDVRGRATLCSYNKKITMSGVEISSGDLVFADNEGVVVFPSHLESVVLDKALDVITKERNIITSLLRNCEFDELYSQYGGF